MYPHVAPICHILTRVVGSGLLPMTIGWIDYMILGQYHRQHVSSFYITSTLLPLSTIENWLPPQIPLGVTHNPPMQSVQAILQLYLESQNVSSMHVFPVESNYLKVLQSFAVNEQQCHLPSQSWPHIAYPEFRGTNSNLWTCKTRYKT